MNSLMRETDVRCLAPGDVVRISHSQMTLIVAVERHSQMTMTVAIERHYLTRIWLSGAVTARAVSVYEAVIILELQ